MQANSIITLVWLLSSSWCLSANRRFGGTAGYRSYWIVHTPADSQIAVTLPNIFVKSVFSLQNSDAPAFCRFPLPFWKRTLLAEEPDTAPAQQSDNTKVKSTRSEQC